MFFAKDLSDHYYHTTVTCALYKGNEKVTVLDRKDFNKDIILSISDAMLFLKQHLKLRYEFDGSLARKEIPELPYEALREALINAVIHRDYFQKGANVMVELFDNRLEISSPGGLPKGLNPKDFGSKSMLRNPNIANLIHRMGWIEKMGTGVKRIQNLVSEVGLPPVEYTFTGFVTITFWRYPEKDKKTMDKIEDTTRKTTQKTTQKILDILKKYPDASRKHIADLLGNITEDGVKYHLDKLKKENKIHRVGPDKGGHWKILIDN